MAQQGKRSTSQVKSSSIWSSPWSKNNYTLLAAGIGVIVLGFILLSLGMNQWDNPLSVSVAPVVLVIGYCVIIPLAIMRAGSHGNGSSSNE